MPVLTNLFKRNHEHSPDSASVPLLYDWESNRSASDPNASPNSAKGLLNKLGKTFAGLSCFDMSEERRMSELANLSSKKVKDVVEMNDDGFVYGEVSKGSVR